VGPQVAPSRSSEVRRRERLESSAGDSGCRTKSFFCFRRGGERLGKAEEWVGNVKAFPCVLQGAFMGRAGWQGGKLDASERCQTLHSCRPRDGATTQALAGRRFCSGRLLGRVAARSTAWDQRYYHQEVRILRARRDRQGAPGKSGVLAICHPVDDNACAHSEDPVRIIRWARRGDGTGGRSPRLPGPSEERTARGGHGARPLDGSERSGRQLSQPDGRHWAPTARGGGKRGRQRPGGAGNPRGKGGLRTGWASRPNVLGAQSCVAARCPRRRADGSRRGRIRGRG